MLLRVVKVRPGVVASGSEVLELLAVLYTVQLRLLIRLYEFKLIFEKAGHLVFSFSELFGEYTESWLRSVLDKILVSFVSIRVLEVNFLSHK